MKNWRRGSISTNNDSNDNSLLLSDGTNVLGACGNTNLSREQILQAIFGSVGELANGK